MEKQRILVVDDDANILRLVQLYLEKDGHYFVKVEARSRHALETAREFRPQLILLDVDMPGCDGGEVAQQLRADPLMKSVPIIFFTSLVSRSESGQDLILRGNDWYLAKPVQARSLIQSVATVLAGAAARAS